LSIDLSLFLTGIALQFGQAKLIKTIFYSFGSIEAASKQIKEENQKDIRKVKEMSESIQNNNEGDIEIIRIPAIISDIDGVLILGSTPIPEGT